MRPAVLSGLLLALVAGACSSNNDVTGSGNSCANLSGNFKATTFTATGTSNTSLSDNFLTNGGAFTLGFSGGTFNSSFTPSTGVAPITMSGSEIVSGNVITLGTQPLFAGAPVGGQEFTCTLSGNTLTLSAENSLFIFPGDSIPRPTRFDITLNHS